MVQSMTLKKGETLSLYANGVTTTMWHDKRHVNYVFTEFVGVFTQHQDKRGSDNRKPVINCNKWGYRLTTLYHIIGMPVNLFVGITSEVCNAF